MSNSILSKVQEEINKYQNAHKGESPLYIILPSDEADDLAQEVKERNGYDDKVIVTEYNGCKIVKYTAMNPGDIRVTNELPETSS
ncbi:hypothetical protein [Chryseosolibacter indicus]|uniref:Uncharacterized protein n=1 Tax=Chryseosolibacter indicus TaxID=2782351 RepID=A0ABS5VTE4_9BACT|nr:hypothetical protein [Chryseosolibacter indicus]MBT1704044.1 hypothetical protein [Chryseosolibacter indicus]